MVTKQDHLDIFHRDYPECDALVTNDPGTALMIYTADCTPLLLHDPVTGAVGAAHAGWKGTVLDIGGKTVQAMIDHFGCDPKNIRAAIGPNIAQCCFETHWDVPQAMINALSLKRRGVEQIEISESCTVCEHDRFWSHRFTRGQRGSQGAIILCKEGTK